MSKELPYRQIHLDFHTAPEILEIGGCFSEEEFVSILKEAKVNSINLFAKCHHGMYYYPTKLGTMHPNLKFDLFGTQLKLCKENGIRALAYTCVAWNEDYANNHPECLAINHEGKIGAKEPFSKEFVVWQSLCINNENYKNDLKLEFKEIYENYKPEGFWIDIVVGKECICKTCLSEMLNMRLDPQKLEDVKYHDRISENKFCKEIYEYIKGLDDNLEVYFNSCPYELDNAEDENVSTVAKRDFFSFIDIESLPSDQWGYAHFPVAVNYMNKYKNELAMMNGKFHMSWGDFGSIRNLDAMEYECFRAIANGAKVCMGDQLHPTGKLEKVVYERIGRVFKSIEEKEPWLIKTEKVCNVGVVITIPPLKADPLVGGLTEEGVYRVLSELHIPFDFVNYKDDINKYELLILPDFVKLNEEMAEKINDYISKGGKILATGESGYNWNKEEMWIKGLPITKIKKSLFDMCYIEMKTKLDYIPQMHHILYEKPYTVEIKENTNVLGYIMQPYFNRSWDHFCSHRQTPVNPQSVKEPAIVQGENAIYIAAPLFTDYMKNGYMIHREILKYCLSLLLENNLIITNFPSITEVTLRKNTEGYIVHTLNYVIERKNKSIDTIEQKYIVLDKFINIYTKDKPFKILGVPQNEEVSFEFDNGYAKIKIDKLEGHNIFFIQL